jgi:hypothetical protein
MRQGPAREQVGAGAPLHRSNAVAAARHCGDSGHRRRSAGIIAERRRILSPGRIESTSAEPRAAVPPNPRSERIHGVEETQELHGRAFRAGNAVCEDLEITLRWEERVGSIPATGSNREVMRDRSLRGPSTVRFLRGVSDELRGELEALAAAARDPDERRRQRDARWAPKPIDVVLDRGTDLIGCRIARPLDATGSLTELYFDVRHEDL